MALGTYLNRPTTNSKCRVKCNVGWSATKDGLRDITARITQNPAILHSFVRFDDDQAKPLGNTLMKLGQGMASFQAGRYPACSEHGAMNKVSKDAELWRCLTCNIGVEIISNIEF